MIWINLELIYILKNITDKQYLCMCPVPVTESITSIILEYQNLPSFACLDKSVTSQFEIQENLVLVYLPTTYIVRIV